MDRDAILQELRDAQPDLQYRGVEQIAVFGSIARGNFTDESDLDILVIFSRPVGLFEFIRLKAYLEQRTKRQVDLVTPEALHPELKPQILAEALYVR